MTKIERTKKQKILRDVISFGVVIYVAAMTFLLFDAEFSNLEAELDFLEAHAKATTLLTNTTNSVVVDPIAVNFVEDVNI